MWPDFGLRTYISGDKKGTLRDRANLMARAKRHYVPGLVWHLTHRCHKREFLFRFARDRRQYLTWLFEAKKRYGLTILNYMVTSNHIHLLVADNGRREVIPKSMQLVAGRTGQQYNERKSRKGAFWEDWYHATAVETGHHLLQGIPKRYSIHVNGLWCITFEWEEGEALRVDLEQYH